MKRAYRIPALTVFMEDKPCVVVGAAPCPPITPTADRVYVAVNGGIVSTPRADVWVLNARASQDARQHPLYPLMVSQGANRHVGVLVLFTWGNDGDPIAETVARLTKQGTTWDHVIDINNATRREIETAAGGRGGEMQKHALSAGLSAACLCFWAGAASVSLEGISWVPGYAYKTPQPVTSRGHVTGDKHGLARLVDQYGDRVQHSLTLRRESGMAPRKSTEVHDGPPTEPLTGPRKVRATKDVFYGGMRYREGDVLTLRSPTHFKASCMVDVPPDAISARPSPAEQQAQAKEIARAMAGRRTPVSDVVGAPQGIGYQPAATDARDVL